MTTQQSELSCIAKTIQQFNRECEEQRTKIVTKTTKKYQKRIQNYIIDMNNLIGEGTFSKVFKGRDLNKGTQVAVKMVELKKIEEMGIQQLFWEELSIIKRLKHPNVVSCYEYFRTTNNCYTVYEYCDGGDVADLLKKGHLGDKQDIQQANSIIKDVFQGLLYLQSMNIVHRDIKGANILISKGKAKLGDFGFATRCNSQFRDASIGSPAYMAPQGLIHNVYGPKTDVWAFGMLIFQLVHGYSPFNECQSQKQLRKRVQVPVNWDQLKGSLPSPLKRLILKCLKVDADQRPTFSQLLNDQYIQKIYKQSTTNRHNMKSTYTRQTSDSDGLNSSAKKHITSNSVRLFEKENCQVDKVQVAETQRWKEEPDQTLKELQVKLNQLQAEMQRESYLFQSQDIMTTLKTEACQQNNQQHQNQNKQFTDNQKNQQINQDISSSPINSFQNQQQLTKQLQTIAPSQITYPIQSTIIYRYVLLTKDRYQQAQLSDWITIQFITTRIISHLTELFNKNTIKSLTEITVNFSIRLLIELYHQSLHQGYPSLTSQLRSISQNYTEQSLSSTESIAYSLLSEQLFNLIKQIQTLLDKQDIDKNYVQTNNKQKHQLAISCGNLLVILYSIVICLLRGQNSSNWLQNQKTIRLQSSQQFYIWLYQIQLQRMQIQ